MCAKQIDCNKNVGVLHFCGDCIFIDSLTFSFFFTLNWTRACCEKVRFNDSFSEVFAASESVRSKFKFQALNNAKISTLCQQIQRVDVQF